MNFSLFLHKMYYYTIIYFAFSNDKLAIFCFGLKILLVIEGWSKL